MSLEILLVFAATEFFLSLSPGPAVMLVVSQGMKYGSAQSVRGAMGILAANALYFALSAIGLGAILIASARVAGTFLIGAGVRLIWSRA